MHSLVSRSQLYITRTRDPGGAFKWAPLFLFPSLPLPFPPEESTAAASPQLGHQPGRVALPLLVVAAAAEALVIFGLAQRDARHPGEQEGGKGRADGAEGRGDGDAGQAAAEAEAQLDGAAGEGAGGDGGEAGPERDFAKVVREAAAEGGESPGQPPASRAVRRPGEGRS